MLARLVLPLLAAIGAIPSALAAEMMPTPPGLVCMIPNLTPDQQASRTLGVLVYAGPDSSSKVTGYAAAVVLARPQDAQNGFVPILWPDGSTGWIPDRGLVIWANRHVPGRRCIPSVMANGRYGYDFQ